jgi:hypothetical protein
MADIRRMLFPIVASGAAIAIAIAIFVLPAINGRRGKSPTGSFWECDVVRSEIESAQESLSEGDLAATREALIRAHSGCGKLRHEMERDYQAWEAAQYE